MDILIGCKLRELTVNYMPYLGVSGLEDYPDLFAGVVIILIAVLLAAGAKEFAIVNKVFTGVNIGVILFVLIAGVTKINFHNWNLSQDEVYGFANETLAGASNETTIYDCKVLFPGDQAASESVVQAQISNFQILLLDSGKITSMLVYSRNMASLANSK